MGNRDTEAILDYHDAGKSVMFLVALGYPDRVALGLAS